VIYGLIRLPLPNRRVIYLTGRDILRLLLPEQRELELIQLELELIQTHMTQKPMLRVEVGARVCAQVKNM
jgi:hypothetical protein